MLCLPLRCSSSSLKHKTLAPLGRLFMRQRGAVATALSRRDVAPAVREAVAAQRDWLWWLGSTLLGSLYPGKWWQALWVSYAASSEVLGCSWVRAWTSWYQQHTI